MSSSSRSSMYAGLQHALSAGRVYMVLWESAQSPNSYEFGLRLRARARA